MIVQWCIKGLYLKSDKQATDIIENGSGLICNWWRDAHQITPSEIDEKLTLANLEKHVNHFDMPDPVSGRPFSEVTPFVSLSAGTIERDAVAQTNLVHRARQTALWFGTQFGAHNVAYLFTCWVLLAPRPAVSVSGVAEEIRDLNAYRRYSPFQTEGEITAKISVPVRQIQHVEKWEWHRTQLTFSNRLLLQNPNFIHPDVLINVRELI